MNEEGYFIRPGLSIPAREVWCEVSHGAGPGGQNVNKVQTAATLCFHPASSGVLGHTEKELLARRLAARINADGILKITASEERSQSANRARAGERFRLLVANALHVAKKRRPTRPTKASVERRITGKRVHSAKKARRRPGDFEWE
ncbi:MAG: aminoacyl-tRNA hydrolase [Planctomycetes bacterium]|nr:aminoacyl-tRNA hydrolase [Planctomycetota bacterium]